MTLKDTSRPSLIVGEQVSGAVGRDWFDGVASDLEGIGYSCRALDIPACSVNTPHIRQRLYWVATTDGLLAHTNGNKSGSATRRYRPERKLDKRRPEDEGDDSPLLSGASPWGGTKWRPGTDGNLRRAQPGLRLVVDGLPGSVDANRLIGNAIVPSLAAEILGAILDLKQRITRSC